MTEEQTIKGEIEAWSEQIREFGSNNRGSRGIKIEGGFHNVLGDLQYLEALDSLFKKGTFVKFTEKKNKKGYWDVVGKIEKITKEEAYQEVAEPSDRAPKTNPAKDSKMILLQVAFKGAVEIYANLLKSGKDGLIKIEANEITQTTKEFYLGLNKIKKDLSERGEW